MDKRHSVKISNGYCKSRYVWIEILAIKDDDFIRYKGICPEKCLDFAKDLNDNGHQVTGIYAYYTPTKGYNTYQEAYWIPQNKAKGLINKLVTIQNHCCC